LPLTLHIFVFVMQPVFPGKRDWTGCGDTTEFFQTGVKKL
jgi:hypothetical protein